MVFLIEERIEKYFDMLTSGMVEEALMKIKGLLKEPEMTDDGRFAIAQYYYQYGFLEHAIAIVQSLHEAYPDESELVLFLAELYMENGQEEEALPLLMLLSPEDEDDYIRAILLASEIYLIEGLFEVAEYKIKQALEYYPNEKVLHSALGEIFYQQENYSLAILNFQKGTEISTYARLADCYAHVGQFEEALEYYEMAATTEGKSTDVLFGYGFVAHQLQKWDLSTSKFKHIIESDPYYTSVYPLLVDDYIQLGKMDEALRYLEMGLIYDKTNPQLYFVKGEILLKENQDEEAKQQFYAALDLDDTHVLAMEKLIAISQKEEDWDKTLSLLDKILAVVPERADLLLQMGKVYEELEEWGEAERCYRDSIAISDQDVESLNRLAFLLRDEGNVKEALDLWKKSLELSPEQWDIEELILQYK
jgi:pentatricopeptide repeat protein